MKNNRHGQASKFVEGHWQRLRKAYKKDNQKLIFDIAVFTGERWGAIVQLKVEDVYEDSARSIPKLSITFRAATRKGSKSGKAKTRQVPICDFLADQLKSYNPPQSGYLFPSPKNPDSHIWLRSASDYLNNVIERVGFKKYGYSTHSTRVTFITRLYESGVDIVTISRLVGHSDIKMTRRYIQLDSDRAGNAIANYSPA